MKLNELLTVTATVVLSLGGGGAIVVAMASWLGKVWASRILQADRAKYEQQLEKMRTEFEHTNRELQARLDKTVHVHRVQFETEFAALSQIWSAVAQVRSAITVLRPSMDIVDSRQTPEERLKERFGRYQEALERLLVAADHQSPFYSHSVFLELDKLIHIAQREKIQVGIGKSGEPKWYEHGEENRRMFTEHADTVALAIRGRIAELSVLPNELGRVDVLF